MPKVAIVYLSFDCDKYLDDVVSALQKITYPKDEVEFIIVDNPHPEHGTSLRNIEEKVMPLSGVSIPHVTILPQKANLGFAAGNNAGIQWAIDNGFEYVYFHNDDGFMAADCLEKLVEAMEIDQEIGAAQSLIMLYPETDLINSAGNAFHFLGFGYCTNFRRKKTDLQLDVITRVGYASGSSLLTRVPLLKKYGPWMSEFFLYHEDLEYSLRMKALGYKTVLVPESNFYHKYQFSRNKDKFFYMERNRYALMLMYFKWPTLILLLPMALVMEIGLIIFSLMNGWFDARMEVYKYWLDPKNWKLWLQKRKYIQTIRLVTDKVLLKNAVSKVVFEEKSINNPLLKYIANPLMTAYFALVKVIIFW